MRLSEFAIFSISIFKREAANEIDFIDVITNFAQKIEKKFNN